MHKVIIPARISLVAKMLLSFSNKDCFHFKTTARAIEHMQAPICFVLIELFINGINVNSTLTIVYTSIFILNVFSHNPSELS